MFIDLVTSLLPKALQPKAKAITAALNALVVPLVLTGLLTGKWDKAAIIGAVASFLVGSATYAVPNLLPNLPPVRHERPEPSIDITAGPPDPPRPPDDRPVA